MHDPSQNGTRWRALLLCSLIPLLLAATAPAPVPTPDPDPEEHEALVEARRTLRDRSAALRSEQDELLFLKTMYAVESKYLVIDRRAGSLQLRYKNRLLKEIPFATGEHARLNGLASGVRTLTNRIDGRTKDQALVYGTELVLAAKPSARARSGGVLLVIGRKDLLSLLAALEEGALAYLSR